MGGPRLCQACQKKLEDKFQDVKQYLNDHPHATISATADEMDVSVKQIKQWVREERLAFSEASADGITCEHCGAPIRTGRFCDKCKGQMANGLAATLVKPKEEEHVKKERDGNRMRFLQ
jgi:uncharacterized protein (UPF0212 family)